MRFRWRRKGIGTREEGLPRCGFQATMARDEGQRMRNWRARLTPLQQRIYDRSASITSIQLTPTPQLLEATTALAGALVADDQLRVEALAQTIVNHICGRLKVRTVRVHVQGLRPSNQRGELHGLYTQYGGGGRSDSIPGWRRTAKRGPAVAFSPLFPPFLHQGRHPPAYTSL